MPVPNPQRRRAEIALGITLGGRGVGLAAASRERLLAFEVKDLHKLVSREGKESRFRNAVSGWIEGLGVTRIALVEPAPADAHLAVVRAERDWLAAEAETRCLPLTVRDAAYLRARQVPDARPTNRALAEAFAQEFPELWRFAPSAESAPGADRVPGLRRRTRSERERYWARAFLALAAARADLDLALLARLSP